jgi:hypothetical protein
LLTVCAVVGLWGSPVQAANQVRLSRASALIGEHIGMTAQVLAAPGSSVELTPGTSSWQDVELVSIDSVTRLHQSDGELWVFQATVAPFTPGPIQFAPTVSIITGADTQNVALPAAELTVIRSLPPDSPLQLSPLPGPTAIGGSESVWLKPALALGALTAVAMLGLVIWLGIRLARSLVQRTPAAAALPEPPRTLAGAEQILESDPVGAYRVMASVVKAELSRRYGLRATALTTTELRRQLESEGERWEARLVSGLLEECDSVIYAGYRPALERREADLNMAREVIGVTG